MSCKKSQLPGQQSRKAESQDCANWPAEIRKPENTALEGKGYKTATMLIKNLLSP